MNNFEKIPDDAIGRKLPGFLSANQLLQFNGGFLNICSLIQKSVDDFMPISAAVEAIGVAGYKGK
jgi:hypothetical protein